MIPTSQAWKDYSRDVGIFHIKAVIDNGTQMTLTDEDFMQGSVNITDSISGMSDFTVGAVITNSFNATLNNFSGKFDNYNLAGARISVQFGIIYDEAGENLYDDSTATNNMGLVKDTGNPTLRPAWETSDYIEVTANEPYKCNFSSSGGDYVCCYDSTKTFITSVDIIDDEFTTVDGTAYIRFCYPSSLSDVYVAEFAKEWINRGVYTLEKPTSLGSTIKVVGYDDMDKLNRYYIGKDANMNDITFPLGADGFIDIICAYCGVTLDDWDLPAFEVDEFEYDESTTCRQVLSWVMQIGGGYARVSRFGFVDCKSFDISGTPQMTLDKLKSLNVYVEDIEITGVRAYAYNTVDEFQFDTVGTSGYILGIQDNPLVTDNTLAVATRVYNKVNGLTFRPFDASIIGDPSIEAGDVISLEDYLGNEHISLITSLTYSVNSAERLECNAKTPEEADLETANPQTSVIKGATMAAYDYILAKKISADYITAGTLGVNGKITASDIEITGGEVGNFTIVDGKIQTTYVNPHTYTSDDVMTMNSIVASSRTPTQEELELYDVNGDGRITQEDIEIVSDVIDNAEGVFSSTITLDPSSYKEMVKVTNSLDETNTIGGNGGNFYKLLLDSVEIKDTVVDKFYYNPTRPDLAGFKAFGIELKSGLKMVGGYVDLGNVAMTQPYGNAYYRNVTVNFPIYIFDSNVFSINVSALASTGLISASVNSLSTSGFSVYVFDSQSETIHVYLQYFMIGI